MLITARGIILRSVKYSETSLILDIFTREYGLKTYIAGGVRRANSSSGAALYQVANIVEIVAYDKANTKINRLKEIKPVKSLNRLSMEILRFSVALFILEVLLKCLKEKENNDELYDFIENTLLFIDQNNSSLRNVHLTVLCKMTRFFGFKPENNYTDENCYFDMREGQFCKYLPFHDDKLDKAEALVFYKLINTDIENSALSDINHTQRQKILEKLILYYQIHLTDFGRIKTLEVFKNIFSGH